MQSDFMTLIRSQPVCAKRRYLMYRLVVDVCVSASGDIDNEPQVSAASATPSYIHCAAIHRRKKIDMRSRRQTIGGTAP